MKIAITGASGLIGSRLIELLKNDHHFIPLTNDMMDITDHEKVKLVLSNLDYDLFLHLAAYTSVDGAETERDQAYNINVNGTKYVFEETSKKQKKFMYISTDFVFDGTQPPYDENSKPNPIGYYGLTKLQGEDIVKNNAMIVRIAYPYRKAFTLKRDLIASIRYMLSQKKELTMVTDSSITPTFIDDIAYGIHYLCNNFEPKTYHLVGSKSYSPYEVATMIAQTWNLDATLIKPITYDEYFKDKAKRPKYSQIVSKTNNFYPMKSLQEGLKIVYDISL